MLDGDLVRLESRSGDTWRCTRASVSGCSRAWSTPPSIIPKTGANVITTDFTDWATNCPEYKVTAVQVRKTNRLSDWQARFFDEDVALTRVAQLDAAD